MTRPTYTYEQLTWRAQFITTQLDTLEHLQSTFGLTNDQVRRKRRLTEELTRIKERMKET